MSARSPQIKNQVKSEVKALLDAVKTIGLKTDTKNYCPQLIYVVVNKKINTRIY